MSRVLSQEELDALLTAAATAAPRGKRAPQPKAKPYNFRRPDRLSKDHVRSLRVLHERFAKNASTGLSAYLRGQTDLTILSIEQFSFAEYLTTVADPTAFYALSLPPFEPLGALELSPLVAFAIIDRLMGGAGRGTPPNRGFTDIELNVVDGFVRMLLEGLTDVWKPLVGLTFHVKARETRPQMLSVAPADAAMAVISIDVRVGEAQGLVTVALPAAIVEQSNKESADRRKAPSLSPVEREWMSDNLGRVLVPVSPLIETRVSGRDVLGLETGDVLSLGLPIESPVTVHVGGLRKLRGRLMATNGRAMFQVVGMPDGAAPTGER